MREEAACASLQRCDASEVRCIQFEVEDIEVLRHALFPDGFGERQDVALNQPAQYDLTHRFSVFRGNRDQLCALKQIVATLGERCPGFRLRVVVAHERHALFLLMEGIDLDLIDRRLDLVKGHDVHQPIRLEVAEADGAQLGRFIGLFHGAP